MELVNRFEGPRACDCPAESLGRAALMKMTLAAATRQNIRVINSTLPLRFASTTPVLVLLALLEAEMFASPAAFNKRGRDGGSSNEDRLSAKRELKTSARHLRDGFADRQ